MKSLLTMYAMSALLICGFSSCNDEEPDWRRPTPTEFHHPTATIPTGIFDYTRLTEHPRLLMNANDFAALKERLATSNELTTLHEIIISRCEKFLSEPVISYELRYGRLLHAARQALARIFHLAYGYQMTEDTRYLERATAELEAVCALDDWHPDCMLDLSELSTAIALGYDWLYEGLSEELRSLIEQRISYITFYQAALYGDQYREKSNYWNAVCNTSRILAAIAIFEFNPTRCRDVLENALNNNKQAIDAYGPDGAYPEGYGAWGYGTTYEVLLLASLEKAFGTDNGLSATPGFLETADYMLHMEGPGNKIYNYGDNHEEPSIRIPMWYFAEKTNNPSLLWNEMKRLRNGDYAAEKAEYRLLPMVMAFTSNFNAASVTAPTQTMYVGDGVTPVVMIRSGWEDDENDRYVAFKGGTPTTEMAHNDSGSYVFDIGKNRWAIDPCHIDFDTVEETAPDYWTNGANAVRWTDFEETTRTYHSTWRHSDNNKCSSDATCTLKSIIDTPTERGAVLDLSRCINDTNFPASDNNAKITRTIKLVNNTDIVIIDSVYRRSTGGSLTINYGFVTGAEVTRPNKATGNDATWVLNQDGKTLYLRMQSAVPPTGPGTNQNFRSYGNSSTNPITVSGDGYAYTILRPTFARKNDTPYNIVTVTLSETDPR